ncbi:hypothetical protein [Clostridium cellulovorans]|uniref:Uncharacterized protein n=1 Tax=Clostridium cellulovorans (strain ATCC 35296 / DSM 3052 / OCM 3 / 743B) TaxID=573061 RepID=D9SX24_CLOC7|nr:hypothetical protein [Clostridium cellulovorans]ADL51385.1 hypothetical protein Clocel_1639 [Clostridium cellulovorans 743B]
MDGFIECVKEELSDKQIEHGAFRESEKYQQEIKYFNGIVNDFIDVVRACFFTSTRDINLFNNSLLFNSSDAFLESAISCGMLVNEGAINPVYRELRYMLEVALKYTIVDQVCYQLNYEERIDYFNKKIPKSSIDCIDDLQLIGLEKSSIKDFINSSRDVYKKLCVYVHPSKTQINDWIKREKKCAYLGFESENEIKRISKSTYNVLEIIITCYLNCLGVSSLGDVFIYYLDEKKKWKFHKSKYIKQMSQYYDYKFERK